MSQSNSESDIWEYKSLKKTKRQKTADSNEQEAKERSLDKQGSKKKHAEEGSKKKRLSKKRCTLELDTDSHLTIPVTQQSHVSGINTNTFSNQLSSPSTSVLKDLSDQAGRTSGDDISEKDSHMGGFCPICQMPFSILVVQTQRWHVTECLETPGETTKECPDGLQCNSTIPNHYKRYSHSLLVHSRSTNSTGSVSSTLENKARVQLEWIEANHGVKENLVDSAVNLSSVSSHSASPSNGSREYQTPVRPNALLLLRSPALGDIKKKKGWSPSTKSRTSTQETKMRFSTPVKADNISQTGKTSEIKEEVCSLDDEDYISYSPLSELPVKREESQSKKKLFYSTTQEESDKEESDDGSLMLFNDTKSDDDLLSDILDQYETQKVSSSAESLVKESLYTCDQLKTSEKLEGLSPSNAGATDQTSQLYTPVKLPKDENFVKDIEVKPCLQSPQSLVLEYLRKSISNSTGFDDSLSADNYLAYEKAEMPASQNQTASATSKKTKTKAASGLKQTDIGVFFGLKPLKKDSKEDTVPAALEGLQVSSAGGEHPGPTGGNAKRRGRRQRKSTAVSEASTATGEREDGAAQPTQTEGGRGVRTGGRMRWNRGRTTDGRPEESKRCPFYKKIPGTGFVVDAFRYGTVDGITAYFLTHFHSDHYDGLNKTSTLPVYCNKITANLVKSKLKVQEQYVHVLPMNTECTVDGVKVILLDANHCPGAAMLLFVLPNGQTMLHTGDFRADPSMERYPELQGFRVQSLYLDTTYCSPEYTFPTQQEVITFAANIAFEQVTLNPRTLVVCGTYSVGKEKVFLAVSQVLGSKVYMSRDRYNTMCCLESDHIRQSITTDLKAAQVHVLPMMQLNFSKLKAHLSRFSGTYDQLVAFKPTGWTFTETVSVEDIQPQIEDNISIYGIPYSEHSSYLELKRFVQWLRPMKIIPTVNVGSWKSRKTMDQFFREWLTEVNALNSVPKLSSRNVYTRQ